MTQYNNLKLIIGLTLLSLCLAGCVDLSGLTRDKPEKTIAPVAPTKKKMKQEGQVYSMLGGLGMFSTGMRQAQNRIAMEHKISGHNTMWYRGGDVTKAIVNYKHRHPERPIILIGHSLGANEQIKVARNLDRAGIPVDLLITVDAVSVRTVPGNVKYALNIYKPGYVPMFSGLQLRAVNAASTKIDNINVQNMRELHVNHFTIDKDEVVQAMILKEVDKVLVNANSKEA